MKTFYIAPFPKVLVQVLWKGAFIDRVFLFYSERGFLLQTFKPSSSLKTWLLSYANKKASALPALPFFRPKASSFANQVYEEIGKIPWGKVCTYKEIAKKAGSSKAFRAVGTLCKKNPFPLLFPCHRVIAKTGIGEYAFGERMKKELLCFEGYLASEETSSTLVESKELTFASSFFS